MRTKKYLYLINFVLFAKQVGDFNTSLVLMKRRLNQIATGINTNYLLSVPMENTFKALGHIVQAYRHEVHQMNMVESFDITLLTDIISTIQRLMDLTDFPEEIRYV